MSDEPKIFPDLSRQEPPQSLSTAPVDQPNVANADALPTPVSSAQVGSEHHRRPRYRGTHPRRFAEKYKEHDPIHHPKIVAKVLASGKTPAGTHRPIMVTEVLSVLAPQPGEVAVDCTLGYGGHALELLPRLLPGGRLLGLDVDPLEMPRTESRLRDLGFGPDVFTVHRSSFAGLPQILAGLGLAGAHCILADLGVSSMQLDNPNRGFSFKVEGPLDMRMNPERGQPASVVLAKTSPAELAEWLDDHADEPRAALLAPALAGRSFLTTTALAKAVQRALPSGLNVAERELTVRRVFQALRIAVNREFSALEMFLRNLPLCLQPGGRVAILTFHSGEDRRVKKAFTAGLQSGDYAQTSDEVLRPTPEECRSNPRATPAKLRWARRGEISD